MRRARGDFVASAVLLVFSLATLFALRDQRLPLDGCAYTVAASELVAGGDGEVFRWSHLMHVPTLAAASRLLSADGVEEIFRLYQTLDMILGAVGLLLLLRLYRMLGIGIWPGVAGCIFVLFSWAYWSAAAMADEKMFGFVVLLAFLTASIRHLGSPPGSRTSETTRALVAGSLLSAALLLHASAVLGAAAVLVHALAARRWRYVAATATATVVLVGATYAVVLGRAAAGAEHGYAHFFSAGVSSYSIFATGTFGVEWLKSVAQGTTKTIWAVFTEDGRLVAVAGAALAALAWGGILLAAWRRPREANWLWLRVLLLVGLAFGLTYAPSAPDSYMVLVIPLGAGVAWALSRRTWKWWALAVTIPAVAFNATQYVEFASQRFGAPEREYQAAIAGAVGEGDTLVVLDSTTGMTVGTMTIWTIHRYANPAINHVGSSAFFADPAAAEFVAAARHGNLFVEGICFENWQTRADGVPGDSEELKLVSALYAMDLVVDYRQYSWSLHRSYKGVYRLRLPPD